MMIGPMAQEIQLGPAKDRLTRWLFGFWGAGIYSWGQEGPAKERLRGDFLDFVAPSRIGRLLDFGCGPGHLALLAARRVSEVVGVDRSAAQIRIARRRARRLGLRNVYFDVADAANLPFPDGSFDVAVATAVLYLLRDSEAGVREMIRVVRPGGTVASLDPSDRMTPATMKRWGREQGLSFTEALRLRGWARGAQLYRLRRPEEARRFFEAAGLDHVLLQERLDGQVLLGKGTKPHTGTP